MKLGVQKALQKTFATSRGTKSFAQIVMFVELTEFLRKSTFVKLMVFAHSLIFSQIRSYFNFREIKLQISMKLLIHNLLF